MRRRGEPEDDGWKRRGEIEKENSMVEEFVYYTNSLLWKHSVLAEETHHLSGATLIFNI